MVMIMLVLVCVVVVSWYQEIIYIWQVRMILLIGACNVLILLTTCWFCAQSVRSGSAINIHSLLTIYMNTPLSSGLFLIGFGAQIVSAGLPVANQSYERRAAAPNVTPVMIPNICSGVVGSIRNIDYNDDDMVIRLYTHAREDATNLGCSRTERH